MSTVLTSTATSAAPPRAKAAGHAAFGPLLATLLTPLSFLLLGYHPFAEDGGLYLAGVKYLLDPSLFPFGRAFVTAPIHYSAFAPSLALFLRVSRLPFDWAILAVFLASLWATIFAAWALARQCFDRTLERVGATLLVALWLSLPVAGTSLMLVDPYLTARSLSTPCVLLALACTLAALDRRSSSPRNAIAAGLLLVLAAAFHPLMAGYGAAFVLSAVWIRRRVSHPALLRAGSIVLVALVLAGAIQYFAPPESALFVRVALTRKYWFLSQWEWFEVFGLAAPLPLLFAVLRLRRNRGAARTLADTTLTVSVAAILVALCFARVAVRPLAVAHLQPLRVFQIVYFSLFLGLGAWLARTVLESHRWRWALAIVLLGGPTLLAGSLVYPHSPHLELPGARGVPNPWVAAFHWAKQNTPEDALFALDCNYITEPDEDAQSFRAIAERSVLPDYSKDGGETAVNATLSEAWGAGVDATRGLSQMDAAARVRRLRPFGVTWMVLRSSAPGDAACPFDNGTVKVCPLR